MPPETKNKFVVRYSDSVVDYLDRLIDLLFEEEYFGFTDAAKQYVSDMKNYIENNISTLPNIQLLLILTNIDRV